MYENRPKSLTIQQLFTGIYTWGSSIVLFCIINELLRASDLNEESSWTAKFLTKQPTRVTVQVVAVVGMAVSLYQGIYQIVHYSGSSYMWSAVSMPQSYSKCDVRVSHGQTSLFTPKIYHNQFHDFGLWSLDNETGEWSVNGTVKVDYVLYDSIRAYQTLCAQGFQANTDLYGLGLRFGVYVRAVDLVDTFE